VTDGDVPQLKRAPDGKAEALFYDSLVTGATLADRAAEGPRRSHCQAADPQGHELPARDRLRAARLEQRELRAPGACLVALHGTTVVPVKALGLSAGRTTQGHRFEAAVSPVVIANADATPTRWRATAP
jgi:glycyl-tRNA synthetase beta chain